MDCRDAANRALLIGLFALQNGLVDQSVLVAPVLEWTRDKSRPIAELPTAQGAIDAEERALLEGLALKHLNRHGGDAERSLSALSARRSIGETRALKQILDQHADDATSRPRFVLVAETTGGLEHPAILARETICLKAMATKPESRIASPKTLADDVERWAADEQVTAWHEPLTKS
jgi:hypothetical protein